MKMIRIMVPAERMAATAWFYADGLGLREEKYAEGKKLFLSGEGPLIELVPLVGPLLETRTSIRFHVHGLDACIKHLVSEGHVSRACLTEQWPARRQVDVSDPAGNVITLMDAE